MKTRKDIIQEAIAAILEQPVEKPTPRPKIADPRADIRNPNVAPAKPKPKPGF